MCVVMVISVFVIAVREGVGGERSTGVVSEVEGDGGELGCVW